MWCTVHPLLMPGGHHAACSNLGSVVTVKDNVDEESEIIRPGTIPVAETTDVSNNNNNNKFNLYSAIRH